MLCCQCPLLKTRDVSSSKYYQGQPLKTNMVRVNLGHSFFTSVVPSALPVPGCVHLSLGISLYYSVLLRLVEPVWVHFTSLLAAMIYEEQM